MPYQSFPDRLRNQNGISVDLSCQRAHLALNMSLTSMTILNTKWDNAMLQLSYTIGESNWNLYWVIVLTSSSDTNHIPNEHVDVDADNYDPYAIPSEIMPC